jgi:hypothetical protein
MSGAGEQRRAYPVLLAALDHTGHRALELAGRRVVGGGDLGGRVGGRLLLHAEATQMAVLPCRVGLPGEEVLREAVAGLWRTCAKRRGELMGIFQAVMIEGRFRDGWLELRGGAIARIGTAIRRRSRTATAPASTR